MWKSNFCNKNVRKLQFCAKRMVQFKVYPSFFLETCYQTFWQYVLTVNNTEAFLVFMIFKEKFPDCPDIFQAVQTVSRLSEQFTYCPFYFQSVWTLFRLSGHLPEGPFSVSHLVMVDTISRLNLPFPSHSLVSDPWQQLGWLRWSMMMNSTCWPKTMFWRE